MPEQYGVNIDKVSIMAGAGKISMESDTVNCEACGVEVSAGQEVLKKYSEEYEKVIAITQTWITLLKEDVGRITKATDEFYEMDANLIEG